MGRQARLMAVMQGAVLMDCSTGSRPVVLPRLSAKLLLVIHRGDAVETRYWQNCLVIWTCICCKYCPGDTLQTTNSSFQTMRGSQPQRRERHWLRESTLRCLSRRLTASVAGGRPPQLHAIPRNRRSLQSEK